MNINIKTIIHNKQRYETCGDWWFDKKGNLEIRISDMKNWKYEALVALHEMIEVLLCKDRNINPADVDAFDIQFEKEREQGMHGDDEPGFDPGAPYVKEHTFATKVEKMIAKELGVDWKVYDKRVTDL